MIKYECKIKSTTVQICTKLLSSSWSAISFYFICRQIQQGQWLHLCLWNFKWSHFDGTNCYYLIYFQLFIYTKVVIAYIFIILLCWLLPCAVHQPKNLSMKHQSNLTSLQAHILSQAEPSHLYGRNIIKIDSAKIPKPSPSLHAQDKKKMYTISK